MAQLMGKELLNNPFLNKGTAFSEEERKEYGLTGLLPTAVRTLEEQVEIEYAKVSRLTTDYEKNGYLMSVYNMNRVLYYRLVKDHLEELMPVIYTPTIADAVMNFSDDYERPNEAVYLDADHPEQIRQVLFNVILNGIQASPSTAEVRVESFSSAGQAVVPTDRVLTVCDASPLENHARSAFVVQRPDQLQVGHVPLDRRPRIAEQVQSVVTPPVRHVAGRFHESRHILLRELLRHTKTPDAAVNQVTEERELKLAAVHPFVGGIEPSET